MSIFNCSNVTNVTGFATLHKNKFFPTETDIWLDGHKRHFSPGANMWWGLFFNFAANLGDQFTTGTSSSLLATSLWPTINSVFKVACVKIKHLYITLWSVLSICVHVCLKLQLAQYIFDTIVKIMDLMALKTQIRKYKYKNGVTTDIPGNQAHITVHSLLINKSDLWKDYQIWQLSTSALTFVTNSWNKLLLRARTFSTIKGLEESTVDDYKNQL